MHVFFITFHRVQQRFPRRRAIIKVVEQNSRSLHRQTRSRKSIPTLYFFLLQRSQPARDVAGEPATQVFLATVKGESDFTG